MKQKEKIGKKSRVFSRREFLKTSLAGAATLAVGSSIGPSIGRAENPIKIGITGVMSGAGGMTGEAIIYGTTLWAEEVNRTGGLLGRQIEIITRDTFGKAEEAARFVREFAASGIDFIFPCGSSAEAFAVLAIANEVKRFIWTLSESLEYTADPKIRNPQCFRTARNPLHNAIVLCKFAAKLSKERGYNRWYTLASDYAYGRSSIDLFIQFFSKFHPKAEYVGHAWPKLFEPDYTPQITALLRAKPDAVFIDLWGADCLAFVKQAAMYGVFQKIPTFHQSVSDILVIEPLVKALGALPAGMYSGTRYLRHFPDTKANHEFCDSYTKRFGQGPMHWSWQSYTAAKLIEAAVKKAGTVENQAVIRAMKDLRVQVPHGVGPGGTVTMRGRDNQLMYYALGWGITVPKEPYLVDIVAGNWDEILVEEEAWLKNKGWL